MRSSTTRRGLAIPVLIGGPACSHHERSEPVSAGPRVENLAHTRAMCSAMPTTAVPRRPLIPDKWAARGNEESDHYRDHPRDDAMPTGRTGHSLLAYPTAPTPRLSHRHRPLAWVPRAGRRSPSASGRRHERHSRCAASGAGALRCRCGARGGGRARTPARHTRVAERHPDCEGRGQRCWSAVLRAIRVRWLPCRRLRKP